jgi:hypothetical protein
LNRCEAFRRAPGPSQKAFRERRAAPARKTMGGDDSKRGAIRGGRTYVMQAIDMWTVSAEDQEPGFRQDVTHAPRRLAHPVRHPRADAPIACELCGRHGRSPVSSPRRGATPSSPISS